MNKQSKWICIQFNNGNIIHLISIARYWCATVSSHRMLSLLIRDGVYEFRNMCGKVGTDMHCNSKPLYYRISKWQNVRANTIPIIIVICGLAQPNKIIVHYLFHFVCVCVNSIFLLASYSHSIWMYWFQIWTKKNRLMKYLSFIIELELF